MITTTHPATMTIPVTTIPDTMIITTHLATMITTMDTIATPILTATVTIMDTAMTLVTINIKELTHLFSTTLTMTTIVNVKASTPTRAKIQIVLTSAFMIDTKIALKISKNSQRKRPFQESSKYLQANTSLQLYPGTITITMRIHIPSITFESLQYHHTITIPTQHILLKQR